MCDSITDPAGQVTKPRVLIVAGYFDWFSGYQETALARAFAKIAETEVVTSNRVSPAFNDAHLDRLNVPRRYSAGPRTDHGVLVTRFDGFELRSMVWSGQARRYIASGQWDLVIQVMPGQIMSAAPSFTNNPAPRVVLYGDNRAMWAHLPAPQRVAKGIAFGMSKGVLYTYVNRRARKIYGYTPNTLERLRPFRSGHSMALMPLAFSPERFFYDCQLREQTRTELSLPERCTLLIVAGRVEQRKRLDWVTSAFAALATTHRDLHLLLVGADSSPYTEELREQLKVANLTPRVHFEPFVDAERLNAFFNAADIGIWPRNPAITIQQSMGTGLPVLLPQNDYVEHLIRHPDSGRYFQLVPRVEPAIIQSTLNDALVSFDLSAGARRSRSERNDWLSADHIARNLMSAHSPHPLINKPDGPLP